MMTDESQDVQIHDGAMRERQFQPVPRHRIRNRTARGQVGEGRCSYVLWFLATAGLIYSYIRIFSRDYEKRREENMRYLQLRDEFRSYFRGAKDRFRQRKDYKFFRCPSCHTMLRVPKGKGKVRVVCRKCGTSFIKKT
jgi:hypothetical protein